MLELSGDILANIFLGDWPKIGGLAERQSWHIFKKLG